LQNGFYAETNIQDFKCLLLGQGIFHGACIACPWGMISIFQVSMKNRLPWLRVMYNQSCGEPCTVLPAMKWVHLLK